MLKVVLRTIIMYILVSVGVRLMGKRQIGDMQPTELVVTLLISEIAAIPLQDTEQPVMIGLVAIFMLVLLEIFSSVLIMKNLRLRRILSGKSVVVIKNGEIDQKVMKSVRMTVFDLIEMLRTQGVFDLDEVDSAVLEINGNLSVRPKPSKAPPKATDFGFNPENSGLPMAVISDGKIVDASLSFLGKSREDVLCLLKEKNLTVAEIFVMTLNQRGESKIVERREAI